MLDLLRTPAAVIAWLFAPLPLQGWLPAATIATLSVSIDSKNGCFLLSKIKAEARLIVIATMLIVAIACTNRTLNSESEPNTSQGRQNSGTQNNTQSYIMTDAMERIREYFDKHGDEMAKELCQNFQSDLSHDTTAADRGKLVAYAAKWYESGTCLNDPRKAAHWMEDAAVRGIVDAMRETG